MRRFLNRVGLLPEGDTGHPWFHGFQQDGQPLGDSLLESKSLEEIPLLPDLSSPVLFLARGHSGTTPLAKVLEQAGYFMGNPKDPNSLNPTYDSLYWTYGFQRTLLPRLFEWGKGCKVAEDITLQVALECLRRHFQGYPGGLWGFKTCESMFSFPLYHYVFPRAKYIYLVRDGRDVILSGDGYFHLGGKGPVVDILRRNFMVMTFGVSDDINTCPFPFPKEPGRNSILLKNRFWLQAKSWKEHVRMMNRLRQGGLLNDNVHTVRYEDLCQQPTETLKGVFDFLEQPFSDKARAFAREQLHSKSIGRWKSYRAHISDCEENMEEIFAFMEPELSQLGYL